MSIEKIMVDLGERSYDVSVGVRLLEALEEVIGDVARSRGWHRAVIVTDVNAGALYSASVEKGLAGVGLDTSVISISPGEKSKNIAIALSVVDSLAEAGITRADVVVALGGGVVGDLAGFAASIYKRGVDLVQLPTTLMSQVDSSIGGKTAVNLESGKNLLGTFHQPVAVIADVSTLISLSEVEYESGLAEVAKYMFLRPEAFPEQVGGALETLGGRDTGDLLATVASCAGIKAHVVSVDEREAGLRAILNYGHTLGHALEASTEYEGLYTHGGAVSVGMAYAALVSEATGLGEPGLAARHRAALSSAGLPVSPLTPAPPFETLLAFMAVDKKSKGDLTMVLLEVEGRPVVRTGLDPGLLAVSYARLLEERS